MRLTGPSSCMVKGVSLQPLTCRDCGFKSCRRHGCLLRILCVVRWKSPWWFDNSSSRVLPIVVHHGVWSINLENEEVIACIWPQCHRKKNPWSRPWEGSSVHLANKFPSFYSTWWFIAMFTEANCWSLFLARLHPSMPFHPVSSRNALMLSSHLCTYL